MESMARPLASVAAVLRADFVSVAVADKVILLTARMPFDFYGDNGDHGDHGESISC